MKKKLLLSILSILGISLLFCAWCKKAPQIVVEKWDKVTLEYSSYLQDWEIIEDNIKQTILIWLQDSFPIFDKELLGMKKWEEKTFTTKKPSEWYGIFHENWKVQEISATIVNNAWKSPKVWDPINLWWLNWVISKVNPATVEIDFNDRQTLENTEFHVTIITIEKNTTEQ